MAVKMLRYCGIVSSGSGIGKRSDSEDDEGNISSCIQPRINDEYCAKHLEQHNNYLEMLKFYIQDVLKVLPPDFIKELNKEVRGWKEEVRLQSGLSKYKLDKLIMENKNKSIEEIIERIERIE